MSEQEEAIVIVENKKGHRFKQVGTAIIAREVMCVTCHEKYWDYYFTTLHPHCCPHRLDGASVINKFG